MDTYWEAYEDSKPTCINCGSELDALPNVCKMDPCPACGYPRPMGDCSDL